MKRFFTLLSGLLGLTGFMQVHAQCTNTATLNWDHLDFLVSTGDYASYVSAQMAASQKFTIGTNKVIISYSGTGLTCSGENILHTGEYSTYTGADVEFNGDGTITMTFEREVQNVSFALYDVDLSQQVVFGAQNASGVAQNINLTTVGTSVLTITNNNLSNATVKASANLVAENTNEGTVVLSIAGPVKTITLTVSGTTAGGKGQVKENKSYWLSDITACIGSSVTFPKDYHKIAAVQPFANQPEYFLTTPDNNSCYMIDPATGKAWEVFNDPGAKFINSFAYDAVNRILYYVADGSSNPSANKQLKKYDFNTEKIEVVIPDITSALGMPVFDAGVESAAAAFYDGALYLGIEGGTNREAIVWRMELNTSGVPVNAYQVAAFPTNSGSTSTHDWGDILIKDGVLYDFNTARSGSAGSYTYPNSQYNHFNMTTGVMDVKNNPTPNSPYVGQAGLTWSGNLYSIRNVVEKYNMDGTRGPAVPITVVRGAAWAGNAGDASEAFRPKMDFGDLPAVYEPDVLAPAVHEIDPNLRLGATVDLEWVKPASVNAYINADADGGDEDGLPYVTLLTTSTSYLTEVQVFNNTGSPATVVAWLDFNKNFVFETTEAVVVQDVPSKPSMQTVSLYWTGLNSTLSDGSATYLRIRITSKSNNMSANNSTGYFANGEVEDYQVLVNKAVLAGAYYNFSLGRGDGRSIQLNWQIIGGRNWQRFTIQRSTDRMNWKDIGSVTGNQEVGSGKRQYNFTDVQPVTGFAAYRLLMHDEEGKFEYTDIREINLAVFDKDVQLMPNPVKDEAVLIINRYEPANAVIQLYHSSGMMLHSQQATLSKGMNQIPLQAVVNLTPGVYFVSVQTGGVTQKQTFIKQ